MPDVLHVTFERRQFDSGPIHILTPAPGRVPKPRRGWPGLLINHGWGGDIDQIIRHAAYFADAGFVVAACNAGMHGHRRDHKLAEKDRRDPWGTQLQLVIETIQTLRKLASYLIRRPDVDAQRLCVGGYSMGGYHAGAALLADKRIKAGYISISSPDTIGPSRRMGRSKPAPMSSAADKRKLAELKKYSLVHNPQAIAGRPVLVINGKNDPVFPYPALQKAVADLRRKGYRGPDRNKLKLVGIPNCAHHVTPGMEKQCIAWLKRWV